MPGRLKPAGIVKHFRDSFEAYKELCTAIRSLKSARASARGSPVTRFHDPYQVSWIGPRTRCAVTSGSNNECINADGERSISDDARKVRQTVV